MILRKLTIKANKSINFDVTRNHDDMQLLITTILNEIDLSQEELEVLHYSIVVQKVTKGDFLSESKAKPSCLYFVQSGLLRVYLLRDEKQEYLIQFAPEGSWIVEDNYYVALPSSNYYIQAIEETIVLILDAKKFLQLLGAIPKLELFFRKLMQQHIAELHWRIINNLTCFADDLYSMFVQNYPDLAQRVPLYMIASYLGVKPETLSRSRRNIASKNTQKTFYKHPLAKILDDQSKGF